MSPDYSKQREALADLFVAYMSARDFTRRVLCTAFGDVALRSVPPPSECVWPPDITQAEADSRLRAVRHFLSQAKNVFEDVLCKIEAAQVRLVASGFDVPRSWIIIDPLDTIRGGYLGACGVEKIVRSTASEDSALETVVREISQDLRKLEGEIAKADQPTVNAGSPPTGKTGEGEGNGKKARARQSRKRKRKPDPKRAEKQEKQKARWKMEEEIHAEWNKSEWSDYQDYVAWKNEHLPEGWPKLHKRSVERAVGNVKRRARNNKK